MAQRRDEGPIRPANFSRQHPFCNFVSKGRLSGAIGSLDGNPRERLDGNAVTEIKSPQTGDRAFEDRVRSAVFWRAGSQIAAQIVMWGATLMVVRLLDPHDYGLFAMAQVVVTAFNFLSGYSFAVSLIQAESLTEKRIAQVFGMLLVANLSIAALQFFAAPLAAAYYGQAIVADMLRVQALLFLTTPFIALPSALLARRLDFKRQGWINLAGAVLGALTALGCAFAGLGVWTLVIAPLVMFAFRAIGLTIAAQMLVWPSFDFRGAGDVVRFGAALMISQFLWIVQSQSDIFLAGRLLDPHALGLYSEALFLCLIVNGRFIPPLNEVAHPAYAEMWKQGRPVGDAFVATARLVMLVATPLYIGLGLTAGPAVATLFGPKWLEMIPYVAGLALAMPFMALQIICSPATNAMSRPRVYVHTSIAGATIMPLAFLIGVNWGGQGLVHAWQVGAPLFLLFTLWLTLPVIGARWHTLAAAMTPVVASTGVMAAVVLMLTPLTAGLVPPLALAMLVVAGALAYGATLKLVWPDLVSALIDLLWRRRASVPVPADRTTSAAATDAA